MDGFWAGGSRWLLELGFMLYLMTGIAIVVMERRQPRTTLVWILAIVVMPVAGLLLYFVIGRRPHRRHVRRSRHRRRAMALAADQRSHPERLPAELDPISRGLVRLALSSGPTPLRRARSVRILPAGVPCREAMLEAIRSARRDIAMEFYIWRDDEAGQMITAALAERARAGIKVRVLYDQVGSFSLGSAHFKELVEAGGQVRVAAPIRMPSLRTPRANFRNHRKIVAIDGEVGFLGGVNIANEYLGIGREAAEWQDLMVRLDGPAAVALQTIFVGDWSDAGDHPDEADPLELEPESDFIQIQPQDPSAGQGPLVQVIPSGPDVGTVDAIAAQFTTAMGASLERCWIATPYLVPDDTLRLTLMSAARRGVDVRLLVPGINDNRWVRWASLSYYDELIEAGCQIFEHPFMIHSKIVVVDHHLAAIGSANMDIRSFYLNYEVTAMFYDAGVTRALADQFEQDLSGAKRVRPVDRERLGPFERAIEAIARVSSPLL